MESPPEKAKAHWVNVPRMDSLGRVLDDSGRVVKGVLGDDLIIRDSMQRIGTVDPGNVQQIAASQLELLAGYHQK
jgi:hypothetical protein